MLTFEMSSPSSSSSLEFKVVSPLKKCRTLGPHRSAEEDTTGTDKPHPRGTVGKEFDRVGTALSRPGKSSGASSSNLGAVPKMSMPSKATPKPAAATAASLPGTSSGPDTSVQVAPQLELISPQDRTGVHTLQYRRHPTNPDYEWWWEKSFRVQHGGQQNRTHRHTSS